MKVEINLIVLYCIVLYCIVYKQSVHTGKTSTRQYISVGYFVPPEYSQDTADASQVECVKPSLLPGIRCPYHATIQQGADNTGIVHCHLIYYLHGQLDAPPHSSP